MNKIKKLYPPGDFGVWIIIYIELITFGLFFIGYAISRRADIELFNSSQLMLDQRFGFVNTLLLITSSFFVVKSVQIIKQTSIDINIQKASYYILGAISLGVCFLFIKIIEFSDKFEQGINLSTNTFFMFYFILTVFHFMHVLLGIIILYNLYKNTKNGLYSYDNCQGLETGASYWHMVDLLWIVLFPLIYIVR